MSEKELEVTPISAHTFDLLIGAAAAGARFSGVAGAP